mmetsp:Transcript_28884/g.40277  ORF Transcript_28884/g.40277 Transcript_28884/m.40277 type:complete len:120 (+) Transcript_28884:3-362(+)
MGKFRIGKPLSPALDGSSTNKSATLMTPVAMFRSESEFSLISSDAKNHNSSKSAPEMSIQFLNKLTSGNNNEWNDSDKSQQGSPVAVLSSKKHRKSSRASTRTLASQADDCHPKRETEM